MKKLMYLSALVLLPVLFLTSCTSDDDGDIIIPQEVSITYNLGSVADPNISGTAKFIKNADDSITVQIQLNGTPNGGMHPAHIHYNTAAEGGSIAVDLGMVDGTTGFGTATFTTLTNSMPISYEGLLEFDGYINVHLSSTELETIVAQADIGQNVLTGNTLTYNLSEVNSSGISGTAVFAQRMNNETLVIVTLSGTSAGTDHLNHIHDGSVDSPGDIAITLEEVDGETGIGKTSVDDTDDNSPITYTLLQDYDGYINIHASEVDLTVVAQGNIGRNALN